MYIIKIRSAIEISGSLDSQPAHIIFEEVTFYKSSLESRIFFGGEIIPEQENYSDIVEHNCQQFLSCTSFNGSRIISYRREKALI